jgi:hypothetical protein
MDMILQGDECDLIIKCAQGELMHMPLNSLYPSMYDNGIMQTVFIKEWTDEAGITYPARMYSIKLIPEDMTRG